MALSDEIPVITAEYNFGLSRMFSQENDIKVFIEDSLLANLYVLVVNKLFPNIKLEKVFPLFNKTKVIEYALNNQNHSDEIYIVDNDFDEFLNKKLDLPNLFYLDRYSVENFFLDKFSIVEFIKSENIQLDTEKILDDLNYTESIEKILDLCTDIVYAHFIVIKYGLPIESTGSSILKYIETNGDLRKKEPIFSDYKSEIEFHLKTIDGRFTYNSKLNEAKTELPLQVYNQKERNISGKYLLTLLQYHCFQIFRTRKVRHPQFMYRIAKESDLNSFENVKIQIQTYLDS
ncbi:MAG TPA: hypothetical protein DF712_15360 [Balneola sp.]|nr:hypothetical protein [Bacteroidota bacterium]HCI70341.1 hypothetical protein [Balneola sp.]HCT53828.1 hypothetical protein [Balneola sp.]|tara:strand:+ start:1857 stop:2723 length:867 start_codon:yes stop_codon:yes gene_type:complete